MHKNSSWFKKTIYIFLLLPYLMWASTPLSVEIKEYDPTAHDGVISVSITNISTKDIRVLKWNTPLEEMLSANMFDVSLGKKRSVYLGRVVKRAKANDSDYVLFEAGEKRTVTIKLPTYYQMDEEGIYDLQFKGIIKYKTLDDDRVLHLKRSIKTEPTLQIFFKPTEKKSLVFQKQIATFNGCSQSDIYTINAAQDAALLMAEDAKNVLNDATVNTSAQRYITWFGSPNSSRQSKVTTNFNNIYTVLDTQTIGFDCTCSEDDIFAYVIANQYYTIYLCNEFWNSDMTGTDSMAGTIVHEMSHFYVIAGTDDYAYGHEESKILAVSNPANVIANADNYEYFAENTPFLSMMSVFSTAVNIDSILEDLPFSGTIDTIAQKDLYSFVVPQSGEYTFYTTGTLDTIGTLYDDSYTLLVENDDQSDSERNFHISYSFLEGQRYYLSVNAYDIDTGTYMLHSYSEQQVVSFVERFYVQILNRASDSVGLNSWVDQLISGVKAGEDIAKGFIFSEEFTNRELDNEAYVRILYKAFFDREADTDGLNRWLEQLNNGVSREIILNGFLGSQEFKELTDLYGIKVALSDVEKFVTRFYQQCLERDPDGAGLADWSTQLSNRTSSGADIAKGFILSAEFIGRELDNTAYLNVLYRAFFGREADTGGFNNWIDQLNRGADREDVLNGFLGSPEFADLANSYGIRAN